MSEDWLKECVLFYTFVFPHYCIENENMSFYFKYICMGVSWSYFLNYYLRVQVGVEKLTKTFKTSIDGKLNFIEIISKLRRWQTEDFTNWVNKV